MKSRKSIMRENLGEKLNTIYYANVLSIKEYDNGVEVKPVGQERIVLSDLHIRLLATALERYLTKKKFLGDV